MAGQMYYVPICECSENLYYFVIGRLQRTLRWRLRNSPFRREAGGHVELESVEAAAEIDAEVDAEGMLRDAEADTEVDVEVDADVDAQVDSDIDAERCLH